jgi:amino acid adenylation domain-containing protein
MESLTRLSSEQLALLTLMLKKRKLSSRETNSLPLAPVPRDRYLPLSFAQQRLWFIDQLEPGNAVYNCPAAVRLEGRLRLDVLEKVVNEIVRRHEALRTRFEVEAGEPIQVIDEWEPRSLEVEDLTVLGREQREAEVRRIAREEARAGFDLSRGPLLRVKVLKLAEEEHALFYTMHHIVSDGWSVGVLIREVCALYEAFSEGKPSPLEELEIQYADYAVWQRERLAGEGLEREVGYWKERLKDAAVMELPTDHPRPAGPSYRGGRERVEIGPELSEGLKRLSQREGATLFMTLMAAFKVVLMRYSGEEDVSVGTVIANRGRREVEGLIGFFVNTLVMRTDLGGNPSFRELIGREREVCLGAYARQEAPFEKLVEEINPERDLSRNPLFQVMMVLQNAGREELEMSGLKVRGIGDETVAAKFDLTLTLTEGGGGIAGSLEYSLDLYEGETIRRMTGHYERVLNEVVRDVEQRIGEIELMSEAERRQIVEEWNETGREYGEGRLVHEVIAEQARRNGEAIAVKSERGELSYGELDRRTARLARYLGNKGIGPEDVVGISTDRSAEMVIAMLGVLKSGAAYLPIEGSYPEERVRYMLEDAKVKALLTQGEAGKRWSDNRVTPQVIDLESDWEQIIEGREDGPNLKVDGDNLAYVIYTSGSTGRPKGVMVRHGGLVNYLKWASEAYRIEEGEGAPVNSSAGFDLTVTSLYGPLVSGKKVDLLDEEEGIEGLAKALSREGEYSLVKITPAHLDILAQQMEDVEMEGRARVLVIGGEELRAVRLRHWHERARGTRLINEYGPTEAVVGCCVYEVDGTEGVREAVPIGKPIANAQIYILDEELRPVPIGVRGEIYISGAGLARGYLGKPELTADRFIPNQFGRVGGELLYRTGDVGRYLSDGNIEFMGRVDEQVKVRGYRIELGEIEAALNEHQGVEQSVVVARENERGDKRLIAYVVGEAMAATAELKKHVRMRLPEYMIPDVIMALEKMPVTANGKVDRKRLPSAKGADRHAEREYVGARTPVEEMVANIFEDVLRGDRVGVHDNFFEIGGYSLLATQVVSRARKMLGVEIGVKRIFETPTVEGLAQLIENAIKTGEKDETPPLVRAPRGGLLPLSFAQQRLWFLDRLAPNNPFYNISSALRLEGRLNLEALEFAINEIIRRHEVLRTRIEVEAGEPVQTIDEWKFRRLAVEDLTNLNQEDREAEVRRMASEEARTGFDLSRGPMLRMKVLKLEEEQHVVLFTMHHIVSDGWSMGILIREFGALYRAHSIGYAREEAPLEELPIQYADYAIWQRNLLQGEVLERQLGYWRQQLADLAPLELPTDYPRPAVTSHYGASLRLELSVELSQRLRELSRSGGATLFITLLAAFQTLLMRYSGREEIAVGSPIANRTRAETEALIGFFANTLVLRTRVEGGLSFQELLGRVREVCLGAYAHQDLPFERLVEELRPERVLGEMPLFQVMFVVQNAPVPSLELPDLALTVLDADLGWAKFDLYGVVTEVGRQLQVSFIYNSEIFSRTRISRMIGHFKTLLESIVENPYKAVSQLPMITPEEHQAIIAASAPSKNRRPRRSVQTQELQKS